MQFSKSFSVDVHISYLVLGQLGELIK